MRYTVPKLRSIVVLFTDYDTLCGYLNLVNEVLWLVTNRYSFLFRGFCDAFCYEIYGVFVMSLGVFSDKPCGKLVTELLVVQPVFEVCGIGFFLSYPSVINSFF